MLASSFAIYDWLTPARFASWVWVRPCVLRLMAMVSNPGSMGVLCELKEIFFSEF